MPRHSGQPGTPAPGDRQGFSVRGHDCEIQSLGNRGGLGEMTENPEIERLRAENINVSAHCAELIEQKRELLAALRELAKGTQHPCAYCFDAANIARAAIAKAEGHE